MGKKDDPKLMQEWFKLVQEKNALVRYESELMILWVDIRFNLQCPFLNALDLFINAL